MDGVFAHGVVDRDASRYPIPDWGKFGFRLTGSQVRADAFSLRINRIEPHPLFHSNAENAT